jgi:glycosyltransferase involved in cell wall biosynthesis
VKVLALNHTSLVSGAERSLLTVLGALPSDVAMAVACPDGALREAVRSAGAPTLSLTGTAGSLKLHLTHTPRTAAELVHAALQLRRHTRELGADVVYANSIRAGIIAALAGLGTSVPLAVHVRDCLPAGPVADRVLGLIRRRADLIIANSAYTEDHLRRTIPDAPIEVIHSPVDLDWLAAAPPRDTARQQLGLPATAPLLGVVAQITPWKAQDDAIRVLAGVRRRFPDAELLLVGSAKFVASATRHDNVAFTNQLHSLAGELGVADAVHFLGERDDVPAILAALDVLLLPSWEEPFGRAVAEGMAAGLPVVATAVGGPPEIIRDGVNGRLVAPRDPDRWTAVVAELLENPGQRQAMGAAAREAAAERLSAQRHVRVLVDTLDRISA